MGKESRIRNPKTASRYEYSNGDRKLYDRDAMPEGLDSDVWELALYFEKRAEQYGCPVPGRPIIYTELYHRISNDPDLTSLLRGDILAHAHTDGIDGTGGSSIITEEEHLIYSYIEEMIDFFFDSGIYDYDKYVLNTFTARINFDYILDYVHQGRIRKVLLETGTRVPQPDRVIKPSKKTEEEKRTFSIINKEYSEDELREKFEYWQRNHPQHT